jgi:UDP-MurNAc hydroxylase
MKLTFIANACCIYESQGVRILTDPWLVDGVFEGSWFHAPALKTRPENVADVDALFISHIHPDHYDLQTLKAFPRDIPIFILDSPPNFLMKSLQRLGFTQTIAIAPETPYAFGPFELTLFKPFAKHVYHEAEIGNLIDSALLVRAEEVSIFNANDNGLSRETAVDIRKRFGPFTVAQLNYNAAGPFPSCFDNLNQEQKQERHHAVLNRNLAQMTQIAEILECEYLMPFAGAYVLGGREWPKNAYLGTTTWDAAAAYFQADHQGDIQPLVLNEGLTFDLKRKQIINGTYTPVDETQQELYIETVLSHRHYPYEEDDSLKGLSSVMLSACLKPFLTQARQNLWLAQERFKHFNSWTLALRLPDGSFTFRLDKQETTWLSPGEPLPESYLACELDLRLLAQILLRKAHWNSAEIGCHINFYRQPDHYLPDVHTLMSFFTLPVEQAEALAEVLKTVKTTQNHAFSRQGRQNP